MNLGNFDRLKETARLMIDKYRALRFRNLQLEQENKLLKEQLQRVENLPSDFDPAELEKVMAENKRLQTEREEIKRRLNKLIAELEKLNI
jgi:septin family protein